MTIVDQRVDLSSAGIASYWLDKDPLALSALTLLSHRMVEFGERVWDQGLWTAIDEAPTKGLSGKANGVKLLTYEIAGRVLLTFSREDNTVSFLGYDDRVPLIVQSIHGTLWDAQAMIMDVMEAWPFAMTADAEVRIAGT